MLACTKFEQRAIERGAMVSRPISDDSRYDFILDEDGGQSAVFTLLKNYRGESRRLHPKYSEDSQMTERFAE